MRICPFHTCSQTIPDHLFACGRHWRSLAKGAQSRINTAYRKYLEGTMNIEELRAIQQDVLGARGTAK